MSQGRTVRLFLVDGSATGVLTAEIMNWTGHVLVAPRSRIGEALRRGEASRTGVYLLSGEDMNEPHRVRVYVGEGDSVLDRIRSHSRDATKDFWGRAFIVTSKDANLNKAHVRYLESRLLELVRASGRAVVANGNEPTPKSLSESDVADMEFFLQQLQTVLPAVGLDVLRPQISPVAEMTEDRAPGAVAGPLELVLSNSPNGVWARAVENDGEITVLAGAIATTRSYSLNSYAARRQELIASGTLRPNPGTDTLTLISDTTFRSPSEAGAILLNRNTNGRTKWRLASTNQMLKEWQDAQLDMIDPAEAAA